jgi:hypothetical protein
LAFLCGGAQHFSDGSSSEVLISAICAETRAEETVAFYQKLFVRFCANSCLVLRGIGEEGPDRSPKKGVFVRETQHFCAVV